MKTIARIAGSALAGVCLGVVFRTASVPPPGPDAYPPGPASVGQPTDAPGVLPGQSEVEPLSSLTVEQRRETVLKWSTRSANQRTCGEELAMLREIKSLDAEQISALLEAVSSAPERKADSLDFIRISLKERLAAIDSKTALELGREKKDAQLRSAAVLAMVTKNAADGLRCIAQLSESERSDVWSLAKDIYKPGGSLADLTAFIKEAAGMAKSPELASGIEGCAGWLLARRMVSDPEGGLAELRRIATDLQQAQVKTVSGEQAKSSGWQPTLLTMGMLTELRELSPEAARRTFDSLNENEKNGFLVSTEANARLKELGVDAAIRFAETQPSEDLLKQAGNGLWRGLVKKDRASALQWLDSLPAGSFRQGVLDSIRTEAFIRHRAAESASGVLGEGTELLSKDTRLDFYAGMLAKNKRATIETLAPSEFISSLPISESEKQELRRRLAPVKAK